MRVSKNINHWLLVFALFVTSGFAFAKEAESTKEEKQALQEVLTQFSKEKPQTENYNDSLNDQEWRNPSLSFRDLGISIEDWEKLIGDRIVVALHAPRTIEVPYFGKMIRWHESRFATAITEFPMSADQARQLIIDNDTKDGWKNVEPFVNKTEVLHERSKEQVGVDQAALRYKIKAKISLINVHGNFWGRNSYEENGDITSLYLNGDVGVRLGYIPIIPKAVLSPLAIANVRRWEFVEIEENRTLVAITDWAEVFDGTALSKRMTQYNDETQVGELSDEELVGPYPGVSVNMHNFKKAVLKQIDKTHQDIAGRTKGEVPDITKQLPKKALESLVENGPVLFIHPVQNVDTDYGGYPLHFVTAANKVEGKFEEVRAISAQMHRYAEYVPQLDSTELVGGSIEVPNFDDEEVDLTGPKVKLNMSLGKRVKVISAFNIEYWLDYTWVSETRLAFETVKGEIETILGAIEWLPSTKSDETILFYTTASDLGPNPKFPLSLSQKIPGADIGGSIIVSAMAVGRQGPWVEREIRGENAPKEKVKKAATEKQDAMIALEQ